MEKSKAGNIFTTTKDLSKDKRVIIFDLDGTLAESKTKIDGEMAQLVRELLNRFKIAIVGGGSLDRFRFELLTELDNSARLQNLFLFPLNGGVFYYYKDGEWSKVYEISLSEEEKQKVFEIIKKSLKECGFVKPEHVYGEQIEDRGTEVAFSALGQSASLNDKKEWLEQNEGKRKNLAAKIQELLPDMEVKTAGLTSIDVTKKGVDKKLAIEKLAEYLKITNDQMLFVGDSLDEFGNDFPAYQAGIDCYWVKSIADTKQLIQFLLS